ncbi:MAG: trigger factor [Candidatus Babeliales bacterium]
MSNADLSCIIEKVTSHFCYIHITVSAAHVDALYDLTCQTQQTQINTYGFAQGQTPLLYVEEHYHAHIINYVTSFLFNYFVVNFLYNQIHAQHLATSGDPRLIKVEVKSHHDALFVFETSLTTPIEFREWKNFLFKAPKRKNYKDIDRQVDTFIHEEHEKEKKSSDTIVPGDWVRLDITALDAHQKPLYHEYTKKAWLKIGSEEADAHFQELLVGRKKDDQFITNATCVQHYLSDILDTNQAFALTIRDRMPCQYVCFDVFKGYFKLKTQKEVHQKMTEVFSFRNDISLRRHMIEEAFKLMISKHLIEITPHLTLRKQQEILEALQENPDYQIYKLEGNFKEFVRNLAVKQVKETLLIDQLIHREGISASDADVKGYLNLYKRPRTKEFIYFQPPTTKIDGQELPIPNALLEKVCAREKALNYLIYHLTRK